MLAKLSDCSSWEELKKLYTFEQIKRIAILAEKQKIYRLKRNAEVAKAYKLYKLGKLGK